jgi:hypothetical protein
MNVAPVAATRSAAPPGTEDGGRALLAELSRSLAAQARDYGVLVQLVQPDAAASPFWDLAGDLLENVSHEVLLLAEEMVDQALADLDQGHLITSPSVPLIGDWNRFEQRAARASFAHFARGPLVELV